MFIHSALSGYFGCFQFLEIASYFLNIRNSVLGGWPRGRVVGLAHSAAGGPVFRWFGSWVRTWHRSSSHAGAASCMPRLEGPTTKSMQLCTGGLWGEKGKNKIFKTNKQKTPQNPINFGRNNACSVQVKTHMYSLFLFIERV